MRGARSSIASRSGDGRGAGLGGLVGAGGKGGRDHRQAAVPAPCGRSGVEARDLRNVAWFGDRTERAGLRFVFIEVYVRVGERVPDAQQQRAYANPPPQSALRVWFHARHGCRTVKAGNVADAPGHGIQPRRRATPLQWTRSAMSQAACQLSASNLLWGAVTETVREISLRGTNRQHVTTYQFRTEGEAALAALTRILHECPRRGRRDALACTTSLSMAGLSVEESSASGCLDSSHQGHVVGVEAPHLGYQLG